MKSAKEIRETSLHEMIDPGDLDAPNPNFREDVAKDFRRNILEVFLLGLTIGAIVPALLAWSNSH